MWLQSQSSVYQVGVVGQEDEGMEDEPLPEAVADPKGQDM